MQRLELVDLGIVRPHVPAATLVAHAFLAIVDDVALVLRLDGRPSVTLLECASAGWRANLQWTVAVAPTSARLLRALEVIGQLPNLIEHDRPRSMLETLEGVMHRRRSVT